MDGQKKKNYRFELLVGNTGYWSHLCVVRIMAHSWFSVTMRMITFHMKRLAMGSMPVEGSSKKTICYNSTSSQDGKKTR